MTAPSAEHTPQPNQHEHRPRLAIDDPVTLAWCARMFQTWMERRRRRLAARQEGGRHDTQ